MEEIIKKLLEDQVGRISYEAGKGMASNLFAYIGIARLKEILIKAEESGEKYVCLADLYTKVQRENLAKENSEVISNYFDLVPKLNQYVKSIKKVNEE